MNDKILITGATGHLGVDLVVILKKDYRAMGVSTENFDIRDYDEIASFLDRMKPDVVLHAAAWADVDGCEDQNDKAVAVNAAGTKNIARACRNVGARMIYYSTDYIFDGTKGTAYTEENKPNPINNYGRSKLEGERYVLDTLDDAAIMRISWLYGTAKECFVTGIIRAGREQICARQKNEEYEILKVVGDQFSCPTWTIDIADQTKVVIEKKVTGIVHAVSIGQVSRYKLAEEIFEELGWDIEMEMVKMADFPMKAPRPQRTDLENGQLNKLGLSVMRGYKEAIREFLTVHKRYDTNQMQH